MSAAAAERELIELESARVVEAIRAERVSSPPCQVAFLHSGDNAPAMVTFAALLSENERTRRVASRSGDHGTLWQPASWETVDFVGSHPDPRAWELAERAVDGLSGDALDEPEVMVLQRIARAVTRRAEEAHQLVSDDFVCWAADHDAADPAGGFRACADPVILERYEGLGWLPAEGGGLKVDGLLPGYLDGD